MSNNDLHVIFGAGPVGRAIMDTLVAQGKRVRIVNRSGKANVPAGVEVCAGDASDPTSTKRLSSGAAVVYNCTNPPYTQWPQLFPALQAGVIEGAASAGAKLVVMENLYMYGPNGGKTLTEDLPYNPTPRKGATRAKMSRDLMAAHQSGKVRVAVGRAADFFGAGVMESAAGDRLFYPAVTGKAAQFIGNLDMPHTYTYMPDIGKALVILGERDEALGKIWHIPSPETVTTRQFFTMAYEAAGHTPKFQVMPKLMVKALSLFVPILREVGEMSYEFDEPFVMDHSRFERAFGMKATPLREAIQTTVAWFKTNPKVISR
jgi:nucleoside-diphosphate-sugar epimerase